MRATRILKVAALAALLQSSAPTWAFGNVTVQWDGINISFGQLSDVGDGFIRGEGEEKRLSSKQVISCEVWRMKRTCYKERPRKTDEVYGINLSFVEPIAIFPYQNEAPPADSDTSAELETSSNTDDEIYLRSFDFDRNFDQEYFDSLPPFELEVPTDADDSEFLNAWGNLFASDPVDKGYSTPSRTEGGDAALALWRRLIGKKPTRECRQSGDYCSIVAESTMNGRPAIVYCAIVNSSIGLGLPFNCDIVAFQGKRSWYVLSFLGPELCDGCGAAAGVYCWFDSDEALQATAEKFIDVVKSSKMNISLQTEERKGELLLTGRNVAVDSQFFEGYYDRSFATYNMKVDLNGETNQREIYIDGLFNLLISAEPSKDRKHYRDIDAGEEGENNLEWLQEQTTSIFEDKLARKVSAVVTCEVQPIM